MRTYLGAALGLTFLGVAIGACSKSYDDASPTGVKCTPGNYVFCRCEDRSEGTKLCRTDGVSFDACVCDGTQPPITEDPDAGQSTPLEPVDSGGPTTGPTIDAKCAGKLGLVAGNGVEPDHDVYVATYTGGGAFAVAKSKGLAVRAPVTILPIGTSLVATYTSVYHYVAFIKLTAGTWSVPSSLGDGTASPTAATSMTILGGKLRLFHLGDDGLLHMGTYAEATGWDNALISAPLAEPSGDAGAPIPGKSSPAVATAGSSITLAVTGSDGTLARETYATSWSGYTRFTSANAFPAAPALTALDPNGTRDMLMVYAGNDLLIHVAARVSSNKAWNTPILFDTAASSSELALQALPGNKAMLVYKASNNKGYYSVWTESTGFAPPAELIPGKNPELASVPSITRGQCGSDATIAYAQKDGAVKILRYAAGAMSGPFDVGGITTATYVGVGELP